jgi:hypothetical protein
MPLMLQLMGVEEDPEALVESYDPEVVKAKDLPDLVYALKEYVEDELD